SSQLQGRSHEILFIQQSRCSGATRLFLDVSCYFKMVTNRRRYASRQAAFMIAKASSPLG
ncbi:hypothetical protein, partial [Klebsiella pneumoniae]|uniref:hypothetical protein n=1 Tax=Klebsiella pneumoniae TaxID=573 RepID=UPI001F00C335